MYEASKDLKFEQAGRYRDQLHQLKSQLMSR
jgi:excinuclease UvrABC nuclease subunit